MSGNYEWKSSREIITGNYQLVYIISSREKCGDYRDTGVSKNESKWIIKLHSICGH